MTRHKTCNKCGESKMITMFYKKKANKDGRMGQCKDCQKNSTKDRFEIKMCNKCGEHLPIVAFHKSPTSRDGRHATCKECRKIHEPGRWQDGKPGCNSRCKFLETCHVRVMSRDEQYWDWDPPCFVTSKYHKAYKKAYDRRVAV